MTASNWRVFPPCAGIKSEIRGSISCLAEDDSAADLLLKLDTLDVAIDQRLTVTQKVIGSLYQEALLAEKLGYDPLNTKEGGDYFYK